MINRSRKIRFSTLQVTYWCAIASFSTFAIAYVRAKGISATYIGVMSAVFMLSAVIGQFFWGGVCDKLQNNKIVFILTNSLMLAVSLLFYFTSLPAVLLAAYAGMGFLQSPTASNLDTWILKNVKNDFTQYGPIRSIGSLGYALFIFFYGTLVAGAGYWVMPLFLAFFVITTVITAVTIPEKSESTSTVNMTRITTDDMKEIFTSKLYVFLLIILFFMGFSTMAIAQMKILIWEDLHVSIAYQGYDGFFSALFQVPMLFLTAKLTGISPNKRLACGAFLNLTMLFMVYFAKIPQVIIVGSVLSGVAYGLLLPAMREIIAGSTPEKLRTTAQGLGDAVYISLSGIMGCAISGVLIDLLGIKAMELTCALVYLIPVLLVVYTLLPQKGGRHAADRPSDMKNR